MIFTAKMYFFKKKNCAKSGTNDFYKDILGFAVSRAVENHNVLLKIRCVHQRERIKKPLTTIFQTDRSTPRAKTINKSQKMRT